MKRSAALASGEAASGGGGAWCGNWHRAPQRWRGAVPLSGTLHNLFMSRHVTPLLEVVSDTGWRALVAEAAVGEM